MNVEPGSSPLARGARPRLQRLHGPHRLIPARAGSTAAGSTPTASPEAHPRSRGEHPAAGTTRSLECGSSPLARGARPGGVEDGDPVGLIPARAGSTLGLWRGRGRWWAHPRSRGEHTDGSGREQTRTGSSPLARGALGTSPAGTPGGRLIPARAGSTPAPSSSPTFVRAHPRSRGEHIGCRWEGSGKPGSSPLARGARGLHGDLGAGPRLIPARAGSTTVSFSPSTTRQAHPRSRGEHVGHVQAVVELLGSSPLARGAPSALAISGLLSGLIPARAGSTPSGRPAWKVTAAHPRSRGEHAPTSPSRAATEGSSPLARGAPPQGHRPGRPVRLIPARAGSTRGQPGRGRGGRAHPRSRREHRALPHHQAGRGRLIPARAGSTGSPGGVLISSTVHPRSRGEHSSGGGSGWSSWGSSPLARGAHIKADVTVSLHRLIPARAGSTPSGRTATTGGWAHPRSRGEHRCQRPPMNVFWGSSPLARGAPHRQQRARPPRGLIPARAGSTVSSSTLMVTGPAHPRSRGEHEPSIATGAPPLGSSPLARGARLGTSTFSVLMRLIPARAGSTWTRGRSCAAPWAHPRSRGEHALYGSRGKCRGGSSPLARGARWSARGPQPPGRLIPARAGSTCGHQRRR